jgi:hypothetical protein
MKPGPLNDGPGREDGRRLRRRRKRRRAHQEPFDQDAGVFGRPVTTIERTE